MLRNIIRMIFPLKCIFCGCLIDFGSDLEICSSCYNNIPFLNENFAFIPNKNNNNWYDDVICACEYSGIIKKALTKYKFHNKPGYSRALGTILYNRMKMVTSCPDFDIIVSVPLHRGKRRLRGYNQSQLISRELSKKLGIIENTDILTKIKNTDSQSLLLKTARHENIKDAFKINNKSVINGKTVLLVDDIFTTGCTANECSKVLKEAGAQKVVVAVIASGRKY